MAHGPLGRTRCRPITADRADQPEGSLVNRDTRSSVECSQSGDTEHVSDADDAGEDQDGRPQHRPSGNRQLPPAPEHQPEQDHGGDHGDLPPKEPPDLPRSHSCLGPTRLHKRGMPHGFGWTFSGKWRSPTSVSYTHLTLPTNREV